MNHDNKVHKSSKNQIFLISAFLVFIFIAIGAIFYIVHLKNKNEKILKEEIEKIRQEAENSKKSNEASGIEVTVSSQKKNEAAENNHTDGEKSAEKAVTSQTSEDTRTIKVISSSYEDMFGDDRNCIKLGKAIIQRLKNIKNKKAGYYDDAIDEMYVAMVAIGPVKGGGPASLKDYLSIACETPTDEQLKNIGISSSEFRKYINTVNETHIYEQSRKN